MSARPGIFRPKVLQTASDIVAVMLSFFAYQAMRPLLLDNPTDFGIEEQLFVASIFTMIWLVIFWLGGLYRDFYVRSPFDEYFTVLKQSFFGSVALYLLIYIDSNHAYRQNPRFVFLLYWLVLFLFVCVGRVIARKLQRTLREKGAIRIPTIILGTLDRSANLLHELQGEPAWGYDVLGAILVGPLSPLPTHNLKVLGGVDEMSDILERHKPKELLVTVDHSDHEALLRWTSIAADADVHVKIVPDLYEIFSGQARTQQIYGAPLIEVSPQLMQPWEEFAKRALDIVVSLVVLVVGLPVWLIIGLAVKLTSRGSMLYMQDRVGRNGHVFKIYKFRSMYIDDKRQPSWTDKNDPRVTTVGKFIRKTHLDEIPQLWNVLMGEMSLVGPRPEQPFFVDKFTAMVPYYRRRHKVRPGVTGWWQVKAKSNPESLEEIEKRIRYDFFYIENMSFKLDMEILVRTVFVMLRGHGRA